MKITADDFEKIIDQLAIIEHNNSSQMEVAEKCLELAKQYTSSQIKSKYKEIERLKGVIQGVYELSFYDKNHDVILYNFQAIHEITKPNMK